MKPKGGKRISYDAFELALERVAMKKGISTPEVIAIIVAAGGPKSSGTRAEACRFYDGGFRRQRPGSPQHAVRLRGLNIGFLPVCAISLTLSFLGHMASTRPATMRPPDKSNW